MFKKFTALIAVCIIATLSACASLGTGGTPAQAVFQAKQDYAIALTAAVAYKQLPPCSATTTALCSKASVVVQLQKADDAAYALLNGAEITVRAGGSNTQLAVTAAQQAVLALTSITKTLGKE